ncbi:hypothetical protein L6164_004881 [Bauhinia variegata]|uniref:Uncharacterized protein n=1 Tax=Bauhinia variegata TaxID=167791 RepID=A0ACB9PQY3_BAUVA|nr:hypothetical protein L6164_004881 [Bauhinia variegata]
MKHRMLECLSFKSLTSSSGSSYPPLPPSHGNTTEITPVTSTQSSPSPSVSREYKNAVEGNSYNEILSKIEDHVHLVDGYTDEDSHQQLIEQVLYPDRKCVQEALGHAKATTLTRLVSTYFDQSETTSNLCLLLHRSVHSARTMYAPLIDLLAVLPADSNLITQSQCDRAFDVFLKLDSQDNPFRPSPDSQNFSDMCSCFSELKQQIDRRLGKSRSRIRLLRRVTAGSALCFIITAVGVVVSAVVITTHAIVALAAGPGCTAHIPHPNTMKKRELARIAQLDAAAKGTYGLKHHLDTINRLVDLLHTAVEGDKLLIRFCLQRGKDRHPIREVLKQLRNNHQRLLFHLEDLEEHICLCCNTVNRGRSKLLNEICLHQTL